MTVVSAANNHPEMAQTQACLKDHKLDSGSEITDRVREHILNHPATKPVGNIWLEITETLEEICDIDISDWYKAGKAP